MTVTRTPSPSSRTLRFASSSFVLLLGCACSVATGYGPKLVVDGLPPARDGVVGGAPLQLIENVGQWPEHVWFAAPTGAVWVERDALVLSRPLADGRQQVVRLRVDGAVATARPVVDRAGSGHYHFLRGGDGPGAITATACLAVRWRAIRPGVDLLIRVDGGRPEYLLELAPGADLAGLRFTCEGADDVVVEPDGSLRLATAVGDLLQSAPVAWTIGDDGQRSVDVRFRRLGEASFGFVAPALAAGEALCVDPVLQWASFVGGSAYEWGYATARASDGTVVAVGETTSSNFPTTAGVLDPSYNGFGPPTTDVYVVRFQPGGTGVVYATYLGGSGSEKALGVAIDASGAVTVAGAAGSSNFPVTAGAFDSSLSGGSEAFVSRLTPDGSALQMSTFVGGGGDEQAECLALAPNGDVWIGGVTSSATFPTTAGAFDSSRAGMSDGFVARVSANGQQLLAATLLGGVDGDVLKGVAVFGNGDVVASGVTSSADFPTTPGAFQQVLDGSSDAFCARLDASCQNLLASTLVGGSSGDVGECAATTPQGLMLVTGVTSSSNFPVTPGAFQSVAVGSSDSFVAAFDASGARRWVTLVGGSGGDVAKGVSVTPAGTVMVGGQCSSSSFPTTPGAVLAQGSGAADAFVVHLAADGSGLLAGTLFGGSGSDGGEAIDGRDPAAVSLTGVTNSGNLPVAPSAWSSSQLGTNDAFAAVLDMRAPGLVRYGQSTPGCLGPVHISGSRWPAAGAADFALVCTQAPPQAFGVLVVGFGPFPGVPVLGVQAYVDLLGPTVLFSTTSDDLGFARVPISLQNAPVGGRIYTQFAWFHPPGCGVPMSLAASDALEVTVQ